MKNLFTIFIFLFLTNISVNGWGQIATWDVNGCTSCVTSTATTFNANLSSSNLLTRGANATASAGGSSFRTVGFKNDGISTANTDYFQITLSASPGYLLSLSTIDAKFAGTATYCVSPGVANQFAYSLDGITFTLIGAPQNLVGTPATLTQISLSGIAPLQNVPSGTTITIRNYASGQTTTGGWGFNSPAAGNNGLAIGGTIIPSGPIISVTPATLTNLNYFLGSGPSAEQTFTVSGNNLTNNIVLSPPTDYEISTTSGSGFVSNPSTITLTQAAGSVAATTIYVRLKGGLALGAYNSENINCTSTGATSKTVNCSGQVTASAAGLTISATTLSPFSYIFGTGPSTSQSYTLSGAGLVGFPGNIAVTGSTNYEVSLNNVAFSSSINIPFTTANLNATTIYVRLKTGLPVGVYNSQTISNSGGGAVAQNVICYGNVTAIPPASVFEIESILVDACGTVEGENEMVRFQVGSAALNTANITTTWPNAANTWKGICQDASTAAIVAAINSTITGGGHIFEPIGGVLPAGAQVLFFTSTAFNNTLFNFVTLNYNLYAIFQCAGNTNGHFVNHSAVNPTNRTLTINFSSPVASDVVTYNAYNVFNGDGGAVDFDTLGNPTYGNTGSGCQAPLFPLPIELVDFSAKCKTGKVDILWQTASEFNNDYFTIEKSENGIDFNVIETITGAGNSNQLINYKWTDNAPFNKDNYYRLKQTDYDGKFEYSNIIQANCDNSNENQSRISVFPNPANDFINVSAQVNGNVQIEIFNALGLLVLKTEMLTEDSNDSHVFNIKIESLFKGIYYIKIHNDNSSYTAKFLK
ncbi:MAG: T9SS type A sorting domain-containing protein [Bacteroidetes bacterium]|nr:T9SS type A sorting domain-containing protein [Bacteroidota bacterium]